MPIIRRHTAASPAEKSCRIFSTRQFVPIDKNSALPKKETGRYETAKTKAEGGARTRDLEVSFRNRLIEGGNDKSHTLYRLSYPGFLLLGNSEVKWYIYLCKFLSGK